MYVCISQNLDNASVEMAQVDGFIFDGPVASESNGQQRITSTSTTTSSIILDNIYNVCVMNCPVIIILFSLKSLNVTLFKTIFNSRENFVK